MGNVNAIASMLGLEDNFQLLGGSLFHPVGPELQLRWSALAGSTFTL